MDQVTEKPTSYTVVAKRWRHGWELHIDGVGVTQSRTLLDAEHMARDYIALERDIPEDSFEVRVTPEIGAGVDGELVVLRAADDEATAAQQRASEKRRTIAAQLKALGLSGREIAAVLGITPQRVSQLLSQKGRAQV
ncbi:DNA-directed RNA polymerase specialized sigma24 family protein [Kitasatospora sp. GAS204A]|nr:DNA-directed RNA polymerase specialized sigma24 family protein [Kitasatospora sp. GAS204B]